MMIPTGAVIAFLGIFVSHGASTIRAEPPSTPCIEDRCSQPPPVKTVDDGYEYTYDGASRTFRGVGRAKVQGAPGATYTTQYVIDCGQPQPPADPQGGGPPAIDCAGAACQNGADQGRWMVVWSKQVAPAVEPVFTAAGRFCQVVRPPIPVADVTAAAGEYLRKHLAAAVPVVQPGERTLVNFPTIVSTPDAGQQTFAITEPLPGLLTVDPAYAWTFDSPDGTTTSATGTGRSYDGTSPTTGPTGYYLTTTFRHSGTGHIGLTATWTGTVAVQLVPPVALDPLVFQADADLPVEQRRTVLLDPH